MSQEPRRSRGKLTWQVASRDTLTASFNRQKNSENFQNASDTRNEDSTRDHEFSATIGSVNYLKTFGDNLLWNSQVGYFANRQERLSNGRSPAYQDRNTGFYTRGYGRDRGDNETRYTFLSDVTYLVDERVGSHEIKAGISGNWVRTDRYDDYVGGGEHSYPGVSGEVWRIRTRGDRPFDIRFRIDFARKVMLLRRGCAAVGKLHN